MANLAAAALCPDQPLSLEEWTKASESVIIPSERNGSGQNQANCREIVVNICTHKFHKGDRQNNAPNNTCIINIMRDRKSL